MFNSHSLLVVLLRDSPFGHAMREIPWLFPTFEIAHFIGMTLLFGIVGLIDLRMLGFARGLPVEPLHRLLPLAIGGFLLNVVTGVGFVASDPLAYLMVATFLVKLVLMGLAGVNATLFYLLLPAHVRHLEAGASAPRSARVFAAVSLLLWIAVIWTGRFIAFTGKSTL